MLWRSISFNNLPSLIGSSSNKNAGYRARVSNQMKGACLIRSAALILGVNGKVTVRWLDVTRNTNMASSLTQSFWCGKQLQGHQGESHDNKDDVTPSEKETSKS